MTECLIQCKVEDQKQVGAGFSVVYVCVNDVGSYAIEIEVGGYLTFISRSRTPEGEHMVTKSKSSIFN